MTFPQLIHFWLLASCFAALASGATLSQEEVGVMKEIGKRIGKNDWDFSVDPCSGQKNWTSSSSSSSSSSFSVQMKNNVTCDCSFANGTVCHVVSIVLKSQNLAGELPRELAKLPYLQQFDLTRNYLNGTIPPEWGSTKLVNISLLGNRVTGPIPKELGNITTLKSLVLEFNQLSGELPPELGNLSQLEILLLTSNNFTGNIPTTFARLANLNHLRLSDNNFSGTLPNFIQSWTSLQILVVQGSGFSGPIPSGISFLQNLTDLRITDLEGPDSYFPPLSNLTNLETLVLRSCNLIGPVPDYLGNITTLRSLDLSFNKLSGPVPISWSWPKNLNLLLLTGNLFTGPLPTWTIMSDHSDVSYNNFNISRPEQLTCQQGTLNLFASSSKGNNSGIVPCLGISSCPKTWHSLHINCGGKLTTTNENVTYDDDSQESGQAVSSLAGANWAFSNTGHFFDSRLVDYYNWSSTSNLLMDNAELYMDARVSALSLTYYGFCLENGSYTVNLHFAEIMFTDDQTYSSLGRRVFDIYIQKKLVLKDFNIAKEAGGVGKAIIKNFTASVTSSTLEIRLQWAGKGTTAIPFASVYGPLISAISVNPDFIPQVEKASVKNNGGMPVGAVVAIVFAGVLVIVMVVWWRISVRRKGLLQRELGSLDIKTGLFTLRQIKAATNDFDAACKIGEGGFGPVYKGVLSDGTVVAVKQLSSRSKQGNREFINEIGLISALQHPCLVKLYGYCMEGDQLLLIYEYMENNSLAQALFARENGQPHLKLDWSTRHKICIGIAKGLAYLHGESRLKIVHRDIKATNVLLDKDLNPKISDFGLAKLDEEDYTHISTRVAGTYGYMAPEYAMHGYLTEKVDVYAFGIVVLEIVSGKRNTTQQLQEAAFDLLDWARLLKEKGNLMELVDKRLGSNFKEEEIMVMINVALLCSNMVPTLRPNMSSVVSMLEGKIEVPETIPEASELLDEKKLEAMRKYYNDKSNETISIEAPLATSSSTSAKDLYSLKLGSSYFEGRD